MPSPPISVSVSDFSAELHGLTLPMGLTLTKVILKGARLTWEKEPFQIHLPKPGTFEAHVAQEELASFLERQAPAGLKNFKVQAKGGKLYMDAVKSMLIDMPAKAVCTLRIVEGRQLFVDLESVELMGAGAKNLVQSQLDKINPVLDVAEFPVAVTLTFVLTDHGEVVVHGTLAPKP